MKFLCSNCKAKYQIPDEKIAGRTLKMDCRRCNTPITIRGDQPQTDVESAEMDEEPRRPAAASTSARPKSSTGSGSGVGRPAAQGGSSAGAQPAAASRTTGRSVLGADFRRNVGGAAGLAAPEAPRVTPLDQWHVAINDVPVGPMKRDEIARKIAAGAATADSLAWREGFDDWRPIREIPELAALLRRASPEADARPGAPRAPAPRAASRPGAPAPSRGPHSPTSAAARASTARNNVVPIGGRLGASAAPSYDLEDDDDGPQDTAATTIASAADLGLADFGKPARDDGEIPGAKPAAKRDEKPAAKPGTGGFRAVPPPSAKAAAPAARVAAPAAPATPAPARKSTPPPAAPTPEPEPEEDDPIAFVPPPAAAVAIAPVASIAAAPPRDDRRGGLGVGALMGIGFAMAAGGVLMYGLVQRFVLAPPPPTTAIVSTVATVAPPSVVAPQHEAAIDVTPPPTSNVATIATPPPTATTTAPAPHHTGTSAGTSTAPPPSSGARAATKAAATGDDPFASFRDDGASPAPLAASTTARHDEGGGAAHHSTAELTADQIRDVVHREQRALTTCWETALRQAGHADGDVRYDIDVTIGTSGRVTVVHARGPAMGQLQDCLERTVRRWVFPPSGADTQTAFPMVFSAQQ
jgi:predicted Zn finger-like uncharacterized protein